MTTQLGTGGNPIFDLNFKKYKHIDRFVTRFDDKISKLKLKEKTYDKGETIFYAGQVTNGEAYMIINGAVDCMTMDPVSGTRKAFNRHGTGEYFGEICLLSSHFRHIYDCVATEKTKVIAFERALKTQDITANLHKINEDRSLKVQKDQSGRKSPIAIFNVPFYIDSREYQEGEFIFRENDLSVGFYMLLHGKLKRTVNDEENGFIHSGEIFGVRRIIMPGKVKSSCKVIATAKVVRFIPAEEDILADSLLRKAIQAAAKTYKQKIQKHDNFQTISSNKDGKGGCPNPENQASSLNSHWGLIKKSVVNSRKLQALKSFAGERRDIADKCKKSLLKMIRVAHKPVEVQVAPMGLGARRQSTSVQMMINEQRYFHKKGVETTGSIVDTQLPNAYKFSVDKHISRLLDDKYRYPYVTLPKALKNHMNRSEIEDYIFNQRQYRRHIAKSRSAINTNNRRRKVSNFDKIMGSLRLEDPKTQELKSQSKRTLYPVERHKRPKTAYSRRQSWEGYNKAIKRNRPRTASMPERTSSERNRPQTASMSERTSSERNRPRTASISERASPYCHKYLRKLAYDKSLYVANTDSKEVVHVDISKEGSIYGI